MMPSKKKFSVAVLIGRFQPLHFGHTSLIFEALKQADRVLIIIGSADQPRSIKNPFTYEERKAMIYNAFEGCGANLSFEKSIDNIYDDAAWVYSIRQNVKKYELDDKKYELDDKKILLVGHQKDYSSFYLRLFPEWQFSSSISSGNLNSTEIRERLFEGKADLKYLLPKTPLAVRHFLGKFIKTPEFVELVKEYEHIKQYRALFSGLRYPMIFVTVDAVVIQSGHVLLIKRKNFPGKGLWAFPGGYVDANTDYSVESAMYRELYEETQIDVIKETLATNHKFTQVFDSIGRSERGRIITHASLIVLPDGEWSLPKVMASDDAEAVDWVPLTKINSSMMFEDHHSILMKMISKMKQL